MALNDQIKWDQQHGNTQSKELPSRFLLEVFEAGHWEIPTGDALDVACGKGRNALFLAEHGYRVVAMDISTIALSDARRRAEEKKLSIDWQAIDLESAQLPAARFDLIVNFNYLQRSLIGQIKTALKVNAHVIFETYLIDQRTIGQPKNPDYLLSHNELLNHFRDFRVLFYREGQIVDNGTRSFRAGLLAQKTHG